MFLLLGTSCLVVVAVSVFLAYLVNMLLLLLLDLLCCTIVIAVVTLICRQTVSICLAFKEPGNVRLIVMVAMEFMVFAAGLISWDSVLKMKNRWGKFLNIIS